MLTDGQRRLITQALGVDDLPFTEAIAKINALQVSNLYPPLPAPQLISTGAWQLPTTYEQAWYAVRRGIPEAQNINVPASSRIPIGIDWLRPIVEFWQATVMAEYSHPNYVCSNVSREAMAGFIRMYPQLRGIPIGTIQGKLQVIGHARNCIMYFPDADHISPGDEQIAYWDLTPRSEFQDTHRPPLGIFTRQEWWDWTEVYLVDVN